jgi:hypothetical protein
LKGEYSHSTFCDHAFDLQHNNGTVFGKNPMIGGDRSYVQAQLEDKKYASDVVELRRRFQRYSRDYIYGTNRSERCDLEIEALFCEGEKLGLWGKAPVVQGRAQRDYRANLQYIHDTSGSMS